MKTSRTQVRLVECPQCGARAKEWCRGRDGRSRDANHAERVQAYVRAEAAAHGRTVVPSPEDREAYRAQVRTVECPACGAGPNERCRSRRPQGRASNHQERVERWSLVCTVRLA